MGKVFPKANRRSLLHETQQHGVFSGSLDLCSSAAKQHVMCKSVCRLHCAASPCSTNAIMYEVPINETIMSIFHIVPPPMTDGPLVTKGGLMALVKRRCLNGNAVRMRYEAV